MKPGFSGLIVDIGRQETKIVNITMSSRYCTVKHILVMEDMSHFIKKNELCNIAGFVASLNDTLIVNGIKVKKVILTGSALRFKSEIQRYQADDTKAATKQVISSLSTGILTHGDYQFYGKDVTDAKSQYVFTTSSVSEPLINALASELKKYLFTVAGVYDVTSAVFNLCKLYPCTYDQDTRLIGLLGTDMHVFRYKDGVPQSSLLVQNVNFRNMIRSIADDYGTSIHNALELLFTYGLRDEKSVPVRQNMLTFKMFNGTASSVYYDRLHAMVETLTASFVEIIKQFNGNAGVRGYSIHLIGSYADIPGLSEALEENLGVPVSRFRVEAVGDSEEYSINNVSMQILTAEFGVSLGVAMATRYKKTINLTTSKIVISRNDVLTQLAKRVGCWLLVTAGAALGVYGMTKIYSTCMDVIELRSMTVNTNSLMTIKSELSAAKTQEGIVSRMDSSLQPLMSYLSQYDGNQFLKVASIDTTNMLDAIPGQSTQGAGHSSGNSQQASMSQASTQVAASQSNMQQSQNQSNPQQSVTQSNSQGTSATSGQKSNSSTSSNSTASGVLGIVNPKGSGEIIIIRGYATDNTTVAAFFDGLKEIPNIRSVQLNAMRDVELPDAESVLMYEIEVVKS